MRTISSSARHFDGDRVEPNCVQRRRVFSGGLMCSASFFSLSPLRASHLLETEHGKDPVK